MKLSTLNSKGHSHWFLPVVATFLIAIVGVRVLSMSKAASVLDSDPSSGLMIQVSSLSGKISTDTLKTWLEQIRNNHRKATKSGYINNLVLQDIADANGNLYTTYLDVIAPYLPGGSKPAFDQVYVGTVDMSWSGTGSKYIEGIKDVSFRGKNVSASLKVAQAFKARYPSVPNYWYITYEANLAGFWDASIENAYVDYINQLVSTLSTVRSGRTFMWSPAFWTTYTNEPAWAIPGLKSNFTDFFNRVSTPLAMNLQDFVGQSNGTTTKEDAVTWAKYLQQNWGVKMKTLTINAEQFKQSSNGAISVGDASEIPLREKYYVGQGFRIGPSWEIRYWHQRIYGS